MKDLLSEYTNMVETKKRLEGYSHAAVSPNNNHFIAVGDNGIIISGHVMIEGPVFIRDFLNIGNK